MAIRMMSGLPARVVSVLTDYLATELTTIDGEEADGITTPPIVAANFYPWDQQAIAEFPACSIRVVSSAPVEVLPLLMGTRVDALHRLDVMFHATVKDEQAPKDLQAIMLRYVSGATRVLCVVYEALQTVADPTRFVEICEWTGEATYGPETEQGDGSLVRTATLPITIRRREAR